MGMRISTNTIYGQATSKMLDLQANQAKLQQQISSGKRIITPSDDPIASNKVIAATQAQSLNTQYTTNRQIAQTQLSTSETVLSSITDLILSTQSTIASAGNSSLSNSDRASLATELGVNLDQLISLANSKDSVGNYLFSGYETQTAPFEKTTTGADYKGDTNHQSVQVSTSRNMTINETGDTIFQANGTDIFKTLTDLVNLLKVPVASNADTATLSAGLGTAGTAMKSTLDAVLTSRSSVGSKMKEIDSLNEYSASSDIVYQQNLSDLQDLDYTKAITELSKQQTILEAAQKSFVKTTSLSLFSII